ncbi:HupE/UreJ family protein [Leifsonia sp. A12D58]|uniref:HupE/UreJ family protein n=1 Tax=Leifsonia sp. A12D58 TaxID=3397674 RepID=UPI0039E15675
MALSRFIPRRPAAVALTIAAAAVALCGILPAAPALAHGFSSVVYIDASTPTADHVSAAIELEYDLLVVSTADSQDDPDFFTQGMDLFESGDEAVALNGHAESVVAYVTERFAVTSAGTSCVPAQLGDFTMTERNDVPYAQLTLDYDCTAAAAGNDHPVYELRSSLFPDAEGYVTGTTTIVTYDFNGHAGSAALDAENPSFSTGQAWTERFAEFFLLGAEHLLGGLDHILFLLALIVGSRRLRDVVLAATTFTVAHSLTFLLAALGLVSVPTSIVEPIIALSIAIVAAWYLWGLWRRPAEALLIEPTTIGRRRGQGLGLERRDWTRLGVVFCFGLIHGLGFASALGIEEAWSWTLLWSLLVFNVGIEFVQLGLIAIIFPLLTLLRRRAPRVALWVGGSLAAIVALIGLFWFGQRMLGLG